jgi:hypothetical protein
VKVQEQVWVQQEVPAALWRDEVSREGFWAALRDDAANCAAADGKALTGTPGTPHVLFLRWVTDPEYLFRREAECSEDEAGFVRLRLSCWAAEER